VFVERGPSKSLGKLIEGKIPFLVILICLGKLRIE